MNIFKKLPSSILALALITLTGVLPTSQAAPLTNATLRGTFSLTAYVQEDTNSPTWTISTHNFGNSDIINAIAADRGLSDSDYTSTSLIISSTILVPDHHLAFFIRSSSGADTQVS